MIAGSRFTGFVLARIEDRPTHKVQDSISSPATKRALKPK
jgi:hypothetical protein